LNNVKDYAYTGKGYSDVFGRDGHQYSLCDTESQTFQSYFSEKVEYLERGSLPIAVPSAAAGSSISMSCKSWLNLVLLLSSCSFYWLQVHLDLPVDSHARINSGEKRHWSPGMNVNRHLFMFHEYNTLTLFLEVRSEKITQISLS